MKKLKAKEITEEHEGKRVSFYVGETYIAGELGQVRPRTSGAPALVIDGIFDNILLSEDAIVAVFGTH